MANKKLTGEIAVVSSFNSRIGQATAVAFDLLALKDGRYIHGTRLFVDGGLTQNLEQGA